VVSAAVRRTDRWHGGVGTKPIIPRLSDDAATAVQRIADPLVLQLPRALPTVQEYNDISRAGFNPQTLEEHLRAQPYKGTTWASGRTPSSRQQGGAEAVRAEI